MWWSLYGYQLLAAVVPILLMLRLLPGQRRAVPRAVLLMLFAIGAQPLGVLLMSLGGGLVGETFYEIGVIGIGLLLIWLWGNVLLRAVLPRLGLAPAPIVTDLLLAMAYIAWGMVRLRHAGMDFGSIVTTSAVVTAVVAFAMQDTLGNILGGLALQLDNSVRIGDWIKVGDLVGKVVDIHWRSTNVETRNWETVVVPNSRLMRGEFLVLGRRQGQPQQWRRWVWFNVGFDIPPERVREVVEKALRSATIPQVAAAPMPNCVLMDFDAAGYGRYAVRYWLTDLMLDDPTDSAVRAHVYSALQRAGIRLSVPEQNVYLVQKDLAHEQQVQGRELQRRLDAISNLELFHQLKDEELRMLAGRLVYAPFADGDVMTRQGDEAHWLYIITSGSAQVYLETGQARRQVNTLQQGSFFGETGMMTGARRSATVVADGHVECYRLDKAAFRDILLARPAIAEHISAVLATREQQLDSVRKELTEQPQNVRPDSSLVAEWLGRIQQFFGLDA